MQTDVLGPPYERHTIPLPDDEEGRVVATLVRRRAAEPTGRAVLWLHGLADYFFQTHVADVFTAQGYDFYALDLRKYGRSLLPHQTPNFCRSLTEYFPELDEAARLIRSEDRHDTLLVMAHSTGGLIASLWAHQNRHRDERLIDGLILNSPFFDLNLPWLVRRPAASATARLRRRDPYGIQPKPPRPAYGHSIHRDFHGEWDYDRKLKPVGGFPIRFGWLDAILTGQRELRAGLAVAAPVLVLCSNRTARLTRWQPMAHRADTVLNVQDMLRWAPFLGAHVTIARIPDAIHDVTLSSAPVRAEVFRELARWTGAYVAGAPPPDPAGTPPTVVADAPTSPV